MLKILTTKKLIPAAKRQLGASESLRITKLLVTYSEPIPNKVNEEFNKIDWYVLIQNRNNDAIPK